MYPAEEVEGGQITFADLPDEIIFGQTYPKLEAPTLIPVIGEGEEEYYAYYGFPVPTGGQASGESIGIQFGCWTAHVDASTVGGFPGCCLISQGGPDPDPPLDPSYPVDNFADTYTVTFNAEEPTSGPAARTSLCLWEGAFVPEVQEGYFLLFYWDGQTEPFGEFASPVIPPETAAHKWYIIRTGDQLYQKQNPQNEPLGTYLGLDDASLTYTVS